MMGTLSSKSSFRPGAVASNVNLVLHPLSCQAADIHDMTNMTNYCLQLPFSYS